MAWRTARSIAGVSVAVLLLAGLAAGLGAVAGLACLASCGGRHESKGRERPGGRRDRPDGQIRIVFKHQPLWGDPAAFRALLDDFRRQHPEIELRTEVLPSASGGLHQYLLTALGAHTTDFDVFVADVIWIQELGRAGFLADLSAAFPPERLRHDLLPASFETAVVGGRTYAVPWYLDVGILYYRTDLVPRAPRTYAELASFARAAQARDPSLLGYLWQGRQSEGLVCNAYEVAWGHGLRPTVQRGPGLQVDAAPMRAGLDWLRGALTTGLSPPSVASATEEDSRRLFQQGRAVFMRNWPYAWAELQRLGSPVRGRVGQAGLPTLGGEAGHGALGGWSLVVNAFVSPARQAAAQQLIAHLTSPAAERTLALVYSRNPPRRAAYQDVQLQTGAPFIAGLLPEVERARPRPVTPYYLMISEVLQGELSAVVSGLRPAAEALGRAQRLIDHLAGLAGPGPERGSRAEPAPAALRSPP